MLFDHSWHSSKPLDKVHIGDILRIRNKETLEAVDWEVTGLPIELTADEARTEWLKYPFGSPRGAERYGYFPFILRNLKKVKEYPPQKPSARYIPSGVRIEVWHRDGGKCKRCGVKEDLEFDHIIPVTKGGSNTARNIELLCKSCNRRKSDWIR